MASADYVHGIWGARLLTTSTGTGTVSTADTSYTTTWTRQSYYNSGTQASTGVTFLNTLGGGNFPGIWSAKFGNSLGYSSTCGLAPAASPQILADTLIPSTSEISLFTTAPCTSANPCPYYRPGAVAYHGFSGSSKIFLFEFIMPHATGDDMPALWFLNAQIPRTQQYGACSCWGNTDGCGELDAFEVLTKGDERMISAIHGDQATTNPNFFVRPTEKTMKGAVVMQGGKAIVRVLDDSFVFGAALTAAQIATLTATGSGSDAASSTLA